jgi:peroxiredoxin
MKLRKWIIVGVILLVAVSLISLYLYTLSVKMKKVEEERYKGFFSSLGIQKINPPVKAKDFTLEDLEVSAVNLKDFQGKVVFLNFWATWCPPCRVEMPAMEKLWQKFKQEEFVILAVDLGEGKEKVSSFVEKNGYTFPVLLDSMGAVANTYGIRAIPTTYLLDSEGRMVGKALGARDWASADAFKLIEQLLSKTNKGKG